eukprot:5671300-Alexandrium_andersonii.AAC.1
MGPVASWTRSDSAHGKSRLRIFYCKRECPEARSSPGRKSGMPAILRLPIAAPSSCEQLQLEGQGLHLIVCCSSPGRSGEGLAHVGRPGVSVRAR